MIPLKFSTFKKKNLPKTQIIFLQLFEVRHIGYSPVNLLIIIQRLLILQLFKN